MNNATKQTNVFKMARAVRDAGLESASRVALTVTSSHPYSRAMSLLAKPGMIVAAIARQRTEKIMTELLTNMNMPSRTDVLALSTRLTHIEMTLDDLSAAVETMRAPAARPARRRAAPRAVAVQGE